MDEEAQAQQRERQKSQSTVGSSEATASSSTSRTARRHTVATVPHHAPVADDNVDGDVHHVPSRYKTHRALAIVEQEFRNAISYSKRRETFRERARTQLDLLDGDGVATSRSTFGDHIRLRQSMSYANRRTSRLCPSANLIDFAEQEEPVGDAGGAQRSDGSGGLTSSTSAASRAKAEIEAGGSGTSSISASDSLASRGRVRGRQAALYSSQRSSLPVPPTTFGARLQPMDEE